MPVIVMGARGRAPRIYADTVGDWEASRLSDCISTHPDLTEVLDMAIETRAEWLRQEEVA
jgi:hypothetical protein